MRTVTVDILQDEALNLLKDLEAMNVIRLHQHGGENTHTTNKIKSYKGLMTKQPIDEIDSQLNDLRNEWAKIPLGHQYSNLLSAREIPCTGRCVYGQNCR